MDTEIHVIVYSSNKRDIWYAKDKNNKLVSGLREIGTLIFDLKGIPGKSRHDKRVVLTIDLSQAEIQLKAHDEEAKGKEVWSLKNQPWSNSSLKKKFMKRTVNLHSHLQYLVCKIWHVIHTSC